MHKKWGSGAGVHDGGSEAKQHAAAFNIHVEFIFDIFFL